MNDTFLNSSPNEMTIDFNVFLSSLVKRDIFGYAYNKFTVIIENKNISMQIIETNIVTTEVHKHVKLVLYILPPRKT